MIKYNGRHILQLLRAAAELFIITSLFSDKVALAKRLLKFHDNAFN